MIDLIRMKAYIYTPDGDGKSREAEIPAEYAEAAKIAHEELVELVAEGKDDLMEEFFEKGTLPEEHIIAGLDEEMRERRVFPIVCMSGPHNIGSDMLLNLIVEAFPSPLDRPAGEADAQRRCDRTEVFRQRAGRGLRFQDHRRSVRGPDHLFQGAFGLCEERRQPA